MHVQGGKRPDPVARVGDVYQERGRPEHTHVVVDAGEHYVELEHERTGRVDQFGRGEFEELFELPTDY